MRKLPEAPREDFWRFRLTLPESQHPKAEAAQRRSRLAVSVDVPLKLGRPEFGIPLRCRRLRAASMSVPEAPMHEDCPPPRAVCEIRRARQILVRGPIAHPETPASLPHQQFGLRATLPDSAHTGRGLGVGDRWKRSREPLLRPLEELPIGQTDLNL